MDEKIFYTVKEAQRILDVSHMTIYRMMHDGDLPSYKLRGRRLIKKADLEQWIEKHKQIVLTK